MSSPMPLWRNTPDGSILCAICFGIFGRDDMEPVSDEPGKVWDVCRLCADRDKRDGGEY